MSDNRWGPNIKKHVTYARPPRSPRRIAFWAFWAGWLWGLLGGVILAYWFWRDLCTLIG